MNHQEAKDILERLIDPELLSLIKVETFRLSWEGKGYNIISEETGYDHDYVRKAGSQLWKELSEALKQDITKRNFRQILEDQLAQDSASRQRELEYPGGALPFSSPFYIERTTEENKVYQELQKPGCVLRIKGPRKMGKSSLMLRVLDQGDSEGYAIALIDLQKADRSILSDLNTFLRWFCLQLSNALELENKLDEHWNELIGSKLSCSNYVQDYVLAEVNKPVVLIMNELNLLFDYDDVSKDFLPLLRSWHEEAKHNEQMKNLRQVLIYSTEVYVQLDLNLSPFNVGLPISLEPFSGEQLSELAGVYGYNWKNDGTAHSPITLLLNELGGHPYLTQLTLYELASKSEFVESPSETLKEIVRAGTEPGGIYSDFLQQIFVSISGNSSAIEAFKKLLNEDGGKLNRIDSYQLEHLGLIDLSKGEPRFTSRLIARYLADNL